MRLPDDIEQRLLDGQMARAVIDLAKRRLITRDDAAKLIRRWVSERRQMAEGSPMSGRRKTDHPKP